MSLHFIVKRKNRYQGLPGSGCAVRFLGDAAVGLVDILAILPPYLAEIIFLPFRSSLRPSENDEVCQVLCFRRGEAMLVCNRAHLDETFQLAGLLEQLVPHMYGPPVLDIEHQAVHGGADQKDDDRVVHTVLL